MAKTRVVGIRNSSAVQPAALPAGWIAAVSVAVLVAAVGVDVFRIGYFADDFHLLDVAGRIPLLQALGGRFGVYPWYRPLSRELLFALVAHAGTAGPLVAHAISLGCAGLCAWHLRAIGLRIGTPRSAAIAAALFLAYSVTKFLVAWVSGFQDVLAMFFMLLAVRSLLEGHARGSALWAFLGVFAKESAFVAFPILALLAAGFATGRRMRPLLWQGAALAGAIVVHLLVRATWASHGGAAYVERSVPALGGALLAVIGGFVARPGAIGPYALALGALAAGAAWVLIERSSATGEPSPVSAANRTPFLLAASVLGVMPLIVGHALSLTRAEEYYGFSAAPWLALLGASWLARLPRAAGTSLAVVLVGWNTVALGYRPVDLSSPEAWTFRRWDWPEAVRLSAVADRLQSDLRANLGTRPESLVVLLCGLENGCYFQTEDGPAAREALRDPTVRAYWLYAPPYGLRPGSFEVLAFNSATRHLEHQKPPADYRLQLAANALASGQAAGAWALASCGDSAENARAEFRYLRLAAALQAGGVGGARRLLAVAGFDDVSAPPPLDWAGQPVKPGSAPAAAMAAVLRRPLEADAHVVLADAFRDAGSVLPEVVELMFATALNPTLLNERLRLDRTLLLIGRATAAKEDLARLATDAEGTPVAAQAAWILRNLPTAAASESASGTP